MQLESSGRPEVKAGSNEYYSIATGMRIITSGKNKPPGVKGVDWDIRKRYHHWGLYQIGWERTTALGYPKLKPSVSTPEFYTQNGNLAIIDFWRSVEKDIGTSLGDPTLAAICWRAGGVWARRFREIRDSDGLAEARRFLRNASDSKGRAIEYARAADAYAVDHLNALRATYEPRLAGLTPLDDLFIQRAVALSKAPRSSIAAAERADGSPRGVTAAGTAPDVGPANAPPTFNGSYLATAGQGVYTVDDGLPRDGLVYDFSTAQWVDDYAGYIRTLLQQ